MSTSGVALAGASEADEIEVRIDWLSFTYTTGVLDHFISCPEVKKAVPKVETLVSKAAAFIEHKLSLAQTNAELASILAGIKQAELEAVYCYSASLGPPKKENIYAVMNSGMRGLGKKSAAERHLFINTWGPLVSRLQMALTREVGLPSFQGWVYRGMSWRSISEQVFAEEMNEVRLQAFTSTSDSIVVARSFFSCKHACHPIASSSK